ncbi:MAG: hypothetical protein JNK12_13785 [Acidimicrobiales bacterium]|nr:hypothetical protein [Acidimicrobiales bacterium]
MSWDGLAPQFSWRPSQQHLLELAGHVTDRRWHLCAPPGAGKTLIGLELARQVGRPTLALAPTTAIRDQWRASVAKFGADPATFTSDDPATAVPLRCVTYQLLGNPGQADDELRAAARRLWVAEVAAELGPEAAEARVRATEEGDAKRAGRELGRHVRALRRSLGTGEDVGVPRAELLGPRTTALVDQLAAGGLGTLVLDECHHLLDWWALVVSVLVERLAAAPGGVAVIGLTATLPEPASSREAGNYEGLLGPVDAELHLAALVAEGALAPWRDGVRLVPPAPDEAAFLDRWQAELTAALDEVLIGESLMTWAVAQITTPTQDDAHAAANVVSLIEPVPGEPSAWRAFWDRDPLAAAAVAHWWAARGLALPAGFEAPPEAAGALTLADRLVLVDAWLHDPEGGAGADDRKAVESLAHRHGLSFTTTGVRWGRSVGDLVCARSSAKGDAAAEILAGEAARRGGDLRALVVVERDQATSPPAEARAVLGEDAGTAARVLAALCARPEVTDLGVIAVTGRGAWTGAADADSVTAAINLDPEVTSGGQRWARTEGCEIRGAVRLVGEGTGWTSARWLAAAEVALDVGAARVLVATRGLVGEGWDHPALDVLVDLSEVAAAGAVTQLRGRALRLDPRRPDKLTSLWDVAVVHPAVTTDWDRFRRRHARWWGPDAAGGVVTGAAKVHPRAGSPLVPSPAELPDLNAQSEAAVADVAATRAAWATVDPGGIGTSALVVRARRRRRVRTRPASWRAWSATTTTGIAVGATGVFAAVSAPIWWPIAVAGAVVAVVGARRRRARVGDDLETLEALAAAVLAGLVAVGRRDLAPGRVEVAPEPTGGLVATVVGVPDDAATAWADALAEALGPLERPRWILAAGDDAWRVPAAVGATREAAEAFHRAFRARVPEARLVRAGTPEATALVLTAARERPDDLERTLRWR